MFIDLSDKKIVVVGGGNIATRRIRTLLQFTRKYYGNCTEIDYGAAGTWQNRLCQSDYTSGKKNQILI